MTRTKMGPVVWEEWFSMQVPHDWDFEEHEGLITVESPNGTLYISLFERAVPGAPTDEEAVEMAVRFAKGQAWNVPRDAIGVRTLGGTPASEFQLDVTEDEPASWRVVHGIDPTRAVLMTWVCPPGQANNDRDVLDAMLDSFAWEPLDG